MKRWFWLLIGMLLIASLSCGLLPGRGGDDNDLPEGTAQVEVVPESNGEPGTEPQVDTSDGDFALAVDHDALDQLNSYRAVISWRHEKADGTVDAFTMEQSATRTPAAERFLVESDDGDVEFIQIGTDTWMRFGDEWMQTSSDTGSAFGDILSGGDAWIANVETNDYEYLGSERVNGTQTRHYRISYTDAFVNWFDAEDDVDDIDDGWAEIWIADEPGLPRFAVKYEIVMTGTGDGGDVKIMMVQEVYDINEPFTIEAPAGVGGLPEGVPLYPDAGDVTSMAAFTMFTAQDDVETVNAFYEDALNRAGWELLDDGMVTEEMVSTNWEKDGQTLSLMITSGAESTSVMISVQD
jgi:hypothetical protein